MNKAAKWEAGARRMVNLLKADLRNARMLKDPWPRVAHSMVQGWRIRLSNPPAKNSPQETTERTWEEMAWRGAQILATKRYHAQRTPWHLWATRRVTARKRYVPKAKRVRPVSDPRDR